MQMKLSCVISELLSPQWHARLNDYNNTGKNLWTSAEIQECFGGKKERKTETEMYKHRQRDMKITSVCVH